MQLAMRQMGIHECIRLQSRFGPALPLLSLYAPMTPSARLSTATFAYRQQSVNKAAAKNIFRRKSVA